MLEQDALVIELDNVLMKYDIVRVLTDDDFDFNECEVNKAIRTILDNFEGSIYIISRIPVNYEQQILKWLDDNNIIYDEILMFDPAEDGNIEDFKFSILLVMSRIFKNVVLVDNIDHPFINSFSNIYLLKVD